MWVFTVLVMALGIGGGRARGRRLRGSGPGAAAARDVARQMSMMSSMRPYSLASSAVNQRSRSESRVICSTVWPVCWAVSSAIRFLVCSSCSAWILMSEAEPPRPAEGWWIRISAFGSAKRLPGCPR